MSAEGSERAVVKVSKRTGKVAARFVSIAEAAQAEGRSKSVIWRHCSERGLASGPWYYRFEDDYDQLEDISGKSNSPVICNGTYYDTLKDAAAGEGIGYSLLARLAKGYAKHNKIRIWWA